MDPMLFLIAVVTAGAITLAVLYIYGQIVNPRRAVEMRLGVNKDMELRPTGILRSQRSRFPLVGRLPISREGREQLQQELDRAGLRWRVQEFLGLRVGFAFGFAFIAALILRSALAPVVTIMFMLLAMVIGWMVPRQYLSRRRKKRLVRIEELLPDALTAISKSLRAGTGLLQALAFAADETPEPLGPELGSALRDLQLGADAIGVFEALSARVGSPDLNIAMTAIIIQRTVGGNLSEILANVTNTIRERAKIQREVRVLTTRQMLQANLTAALPVGIAVLFIIISPDIGGTLIHTTVGNIALAFAVACEVAGLYVVRRLAVIEV